MTYLFNAFKAAVSDFKSQSILCNICSFTCRLCSFRKILEKFWFLWRRRPRASKPSDLYSSSEWKKELEERIPVQTFVNTKSPNFHLNHFSLSFFFWLNSHSPPPKLNISTYNSSSSSASSFHTRPVQKNLLRSVEITRDTFKLDSHTMFAFPVLESCFRRCPIKAL